MAKSAFWLRYINEDPVRIPPSPWDTVTIGSIQLPGVVEVEGDIGNRLDMKQPKGRSSARLEFSGYKPAEITINVQIWTADHWSSLQQLVIAIRPVNSVGIPKAFDVVHPVFEAYNIRSIAIREISFPKSESKSGAGRQIKIVTIKAWEFIPIEWKKQEKTGEAAAGVYKGSLAAPGLGAEEHLFKSDRRPPSDVPTLPGFKTGDDYSALIKQTNSEKEDKTKTPAALVVDADDSAR